MLVRLAQVDAGRTTELRVGDAVELRLPEVPSSGYRWRWRLPEGVRLTADEHIGAQGHPKGGRAGPEQGPPGQGGVRRLAFDIVGAGRHLLAAELARPWEDGPRRSLTFPLLATTTAITTPNE
ncbi:protease inhibitor I42 family protein [Amycolatopsis cihanbeyliensis]|uniref:Putative secreted protein n=1 Tax=Amycolatopsis cihanbeyliensis TaxID=1128664 RepID=A0A542DKP7_AMYCI|nr:protease inhibitor I42 family protein [Amycolatopsis cihanbeyliensis]TQJ03672.1 putative secreted protein [Amycolatopsis cihanbeyliensis]